MNQSELDFLASCISWIDDEKKRDAAITLCNNHYGHDPYYSPQKFLNLLEQKVRLNEEFDLVVFNSATEEFYCPECNHFCDLPKYEEDVEFDCECGGTLVPVTEQVQAEEKVRRAKEEIAEENPDAMFADGLEIAFLGVASQFNSPPLAVYDYDKCIDIFIERDGLTYDEAMEHMDYNVLGAWVGKGTPLFLYSIDCEE